MGFGGGDTLNYNQLQAAYTQMTESMKERFLKNHLKSDVFSGIPRLRRLDVNHVAYHEPGVLLLAHIPLMSKYYQLLSIAADEQKKGLRGTLDIGKDPLLGPAQKDWLDASRFLVYDTPRLLRHKLEQAFFDLKESDLEIERVLLIEHLMQFTVNNLLTDSSGAPCSALEQALGYMGRVEIYSAMMPDNDYDALDIFRAPGAPSAPQMLLSVKSASGRKELGGGTPMHRYLLFSDKHSSEPKN